MKKIVHLFLLLIFGFANAQQYITGKVTTEMDARVPRVMVYNVRSDEMVQADKNGHFIIKAVPGDELRFIKRDFERFSLKVKAEDFSNPMNISIRLLPKMIEEVEIAFKPTGNLKKDTRALDRPKKEEELNNSLANLLRTPPAMSYPSNQTPSTLILGPNFSASQLSLLSIGSDGIVGGIIGSIVKVGSPVKTESNYIEKQEFYKKVKQLVDLQYFYDRGLDEYQFDMLVAYADAKYNLAKNYRARFNKAVIERYLRQEVEEFLNTKISTQNLLCNTLEIMFLLVRERQGYCI